MIRATRFTLRLLPHAKLVTFCFLGWCLLISEREECKGTALRIKSLRSPKKIVSNLFKVIFLLLLLDLLASAAWAIYILNKTGDFEKQSSFQVVVILMGDFNPNHTSLGPETLRRLNFALSLRDEIPIGNFLCVGGSRPTENVFGADLMKDYLHKNGVPVEQIYANGGSFDTKGNWQDAITLIKQKNWKTVGVISSAFHLYRAKKFVITPPEQLSVSFVPFQYRNSQPKTTVLELWRWVHYEWIAYTLYALPLPIYNAILLLDRPQ